MTSMSKGLGILALTALIGCGGAQTRPDTTTMAANDMANTLAVAAAMTLAKMDRCVAIVPFNGIDTKWCVDEKGGEFLQCSTIPKERFCKISNIN